MPDFNMVVVGSGGGPDEHNLSSYLVKTSQSRWQDGILSLDAGSGLGALQHILENNPSLFTDGDASGRTDVPSFPGHSASSVYEKISSFVVTHGHLDHVASLVVGAGSQSGPSKRIFGLPNTIRTLETLFNGSIWPKLAVHEGEDVPPSFYTYRTVHPQETYVRVAHDISARVLPVSHGPCQHPCSSKSYESSAWFVRNDSSGKEFLFFGDVEPDSISASPRTRQVWRMAASKIRKGTLDTIFLECSYRSNRPNASLYGHLSPPHVLDELRALATEVKTFQEGMKSSSRQKPSIISSFLRAMGLWSRSVEHLAPTLSDSELAGTLKGLRLVVTHCKSTSQPLPDGKDIADVISQEVTDLVNAAGLGILVVAAKQGERIDI